MPITDTNDYVPDPREEIMWAALGVAAVIAVVVHFLFK